MTLEHVALIILIVASLLVFYGIIAIHDIPYEIAKKRNHPHQEAIHYAGWVSLFTLHVLWPFLWIWATVWQPGRGWGIKQLEDDQLGLHQKLEALDSQVKNLHDQVNKLEKSLSLATNPVTAAPPVSVTEAKNLAGDK
ncbi:GTPase [Salmonella enterica subsp. enterica serovar Choleraesuis]|nr:GTPase [Salmonella enterica subsp. enterica serovar Choleraesuis]